MKRHMQNFHTDPMLLLVLVCVMAPAVVAAPATQTNKTEIARSIFTIPSNPQQGRDPFFPDSTRPYQHAVITSHQSNVITSLTIRGFSGPLNHRLVIINNHTFAAGDEGDVTTPDGRVHLRCIEIKTNSVIIEVDGQRQELPYSDKL